MRSLAIILFVIVSLTRCAPESDFNAIPYTKKLVVDGAIENNGFPRVQLSYSAAYFHEIDSANIRDLMESTAKVTVSDGEQEEVLTLRRDNTLFPPFYYEGTSIVGKAGKRYDLTIELKGEVYTATTTIPEPKKLDKLWFALAPDKDSLGYLYGKISDNATEQNYYRLFTQRKNVDSRFFPVYLSAIDDHYFDGKSFTFTVFRGPENFSEIKDDLYFAKGDTIKLKFCTMDKSHYDFWRTMERELYVVGNPFASSGNDVLSNIQGKNVLGVWGGYGVTLYETVAR